MFSALSSYIWGSYEESETKTVEQQPDDQIELENDWIFVKPKGPSETRRHVQFNDDGCSTTSESSTVPNGMEESWLVTPPQCFNSSRRKNKNAESSPLENLLIEHPSMSIYQDNDAINEESDEVDNTVVAHRGETHHAVAGRLQQLEKRQPLKDLNEKSQKSSSPKKMKRKNMVYVRSRNTRNNKQYGRQNGKHVGMVGKRGS